MAPEVVKGKLAICEPAVTDTPQADKTQNRTDMNTLLNRTSTWFKNLCTVKSLKLLAEISHKF